MNLRAFQSARSRMRQEDDERSQAHQNEIENQARATLEKEVTLGRRQLAIQLRILGGIAVVMVILIAGAAIFYAHQLQLHRERVAAEYEHAQQCLKGENFVCARDGFSNVLKDEPHYLDAEDRLREAHRALAIKYSSAGQWEFAVNELDSILKEIPNDTDTLALLKDVFKRWYDDALVREDWGAAIRIRLQGSARFPDGF